MPRTKLGRKSYKYFPCKKEWNVDVVTLPDNIFYSTRIPDGLWFLTRNRRSRVPTRPVSDHHGQILLIDARKIGRIANLTYCELTNDDIARITNTYHDWRTVEARQASSLPEYRPPWTL